MVMKCGTTVPALFLQLLDLAEGLLRLCHTALIQQRAAEIIHRDAARDRRVPALFGKC